MKYYRFIDINKYLHFCDNEDALSEDDKINKIQKFADLLNKNFVKFYSPSQHLCIDESLVKWRGRGQKVYIKDKAAKFGMKFFKIATGNGYVLRVLLYISNPLVVTCNADYVCQILMDGYLGKGHILCTDNWYTSIPLAIYLAENQTYLVGNFF